MKTGELHNKLATVVEGMLDGTLTLRELARRADLGYLAVQQFAKVMHEVGACHIDSWETDRLGRHTVRIYKIGRGPDAKRPRQSNAKRLRGQADRQRMVQMIQLTAGPIA